MNVSWIFKNGIDSIPKCKYNLHVKPLQFVKENTNEKRYLRFCVAIAVLLQRKTYAFTVQNSRFYNVK